MDGGGLSERLTGDGGFCIIVNQDRKDDLKALKSIRVIFFALQKK